MSRYCKTDKSASDFESGLVRLGVCHTIEEFWGLYVYMRRASELARDTKLHLFRGSNAPMWEVSEILFVFRVYSPSVRIILMEDIGVLELERDAHC
jgi:hypothetical protein